MDWQHAVIAFLVAFVVIYLLLERMTKDDGNG